MLISVLWSSNVLSSFPVAFSSLKSLSVLDLSKNRIPEVPDGVSGLQVVELILNQNQIRKVSKDLALCPHLKTLRLQENTLEVQGLPIEILRDSPISLLSVEGNLFDIKQLSDLEGYEIVSSTASYNIGFNNFALSIKPCEIWFFSVHGSLHKYKKETYVTGISTLWKKVKVRVRHPPSPFSLCMCEGWESLCVLFFAFRGVFTESDQCCVTLYESSWTNLIN